MWTDALRLDNLFKVGKVCSTSHQWNCYFIWLLGTFLRGLRANIRGWFSALVARAKREKGRFCLDVFCFLYGWQPHIYHSISRARLPRSAKEAPARCREKLHSLADWLKKVSLEIERVGGTRRNRHLSERQREFENYWRLQCGRRERYVH